MYIVFFDSGLGGLNTLKVALSKMPRESFIYFGDTANVPYGIKSAEEVRSLLTAAVDKLKGYRIKAWVLACNTATSVAADFLRERCSFPIIGMEPAVKPAVQYTEGRGRRIMLLATVLTLKSERIAGLRARVDPENIIDAVPASELVEYVERLEFDQEAVENHLRRKLSGYDLNDYSCVVLGSTHFNYFETALRNLFPAGTKILDGNEGTVNRLAEVIQYSDRLAGDGPAPEVLLHLSDQADQRKIKAALGILENVSRTPVRVI